MTRYGLWKLNEGSGTTVADADASPVNLTVAATGASAWSSNRGSGWHNAGNPGSTIKSGSLSGSKIASGLAGSTKGVWSFTYSTSSTGSTALVAIATSTDSSQFEVYAGSIWWGNQQLFSSASYPLTSTYTHLAVVVDSTLASNRGRVFANGFQIQQGNGSVAQNRAIDSANALSTGLVCLTCGGDGAARITGDIYSAALYDTLSDGKILDHALKWRESNDIDPDAAGLAILGAGTNSGTNDASTSSSDTAFSATRTIGASGANRCVLAIVSWEGNSPTSVQFDPGGVNAAMTLVASATSGSQGVGIYFLPDASLPSGANIYTVTATLGSGGTGCITTDYFEGASQSTPSNFITNTGTSTSIAGTLPSSAAAGSFVIAACFDDTTTDTPTCALPETIFPKVNGTSTGNTHTLASSGRYVNSSGSVTMTFSGLTNSSQKLLVAVEIAVASAGTPVTSTFALSCESLGGVAAAKQLPAEGLGGHAAASASSLESLAPVTALRTGNLEAARGIAAGFAACIEGLGGHAAPAAGPIENLAVTSSARAVNCEALTSATRTTAHAVESLARAAAARALALEALSGIVGARTVPVESLRSLVAATVENIESTAQGVVVAFAGTNIEALATTSSAQTHRLESAALVSAPKVGSLEWLLGRSAGAILQAEALGSVLAARALNIEAIAQGVVVALKQLRIESLAASSVPAQTAVEFLAAVNVTRTSPLELGRGLIAARVLLVEALAGLVALEVCRIEAEGLGVVVPAPAERRAKLRAGGRRAELRARIGVAMLLALSRKGRLLP